MAIGDIARAAGLPEQCIAIVARWEGCLKKIAHDLYKAYLCPARVPTIGIGTTQYNDRGGIPVKLSDPPISRAEAERLLAYDLRVKYAPAVRRAVKPGAFKTNNQFSTCVSFTYNVGTAGFSKSTFCWLINQGQYDRAANELLRWTRGGGRVLPGLVNRRRDERALFLKPGDPYGEISQPMATPVASIPVIEAHPRKETAKQARKGWIQSILFWRK